MAQQLTIQDVLNRLSEYEDSDVLGSRVKGLVNPFTLSPDMLLSFSKSDLHSDLPHKFINALSNTKRALDCQIECIFHTLGISLPLDFPQKIDVLNKLGLVAPSILLRINHSRNLLEHEFANPSPELVLDALDTVNIFVAYTSARLLKFRDEIVFWGEIAMINVCDNHLQIRLREKNSLTLHPSNPEYFDVLKWLIQISNEWW